MKGLGNLSAIDADTTDTFTFSLENDTGDFFKIIDDTKLRLISAIDYEKYKTKSVDVRVTDAAGHEYVLRYRWQQECEWYCSHLRLRIGCC
jgi:hypothetical protein